MKEETNTNTTPESSPKKPWYKSIWGILTISTIIIVCGYFGLKKYGDNLFTREMFTEYPPILSDTLTQNIDSVEIGENEFDSVSILLDSSTTVLDSNEILNSTLVEIDSTENLEIENSIPPPPIIKDDNTGITDLFKVNTSYDKIEETPVTTNSKGEVISATKTNLTKGLFEELLFPENMDEDFEVAFEKYSQANIVSSKSVLKILSIVGKQILLGKNVDDFEDMLEILTESKEVKGVIIVDRKGKVVYATNQKFVNTLLQNNFPQLDIKASNLTWYEEGKEQVAALPLYHTFGRIGWVVLVTGE